MWQKVILVTSGARSLKGRFFKALPLQDHSWLGSQQPWCKDNHAACGKAHVGRNWGLLPTASINLPTTGESYPGSGSVSPKSSLWQLQPQPTFLLQSFEIPVFSPTNSYAWIPDSQKWRLINVYYCFKPLCLGWFVMQQETTKTKEEYSDIFYNKKFNGINYRDMIKDEIE